MKSCSKTRSSKSACANIFLELPLTNSGIILEWMQHHAIDHTLTFIQWLLIYLHLQFWQSRRSRIHKQPPEVFLKFFANFTGKHLCWSLFFTKLQAFRPATLLKIDSYTSVFLWNLRNSEEHLFWRASERLLLCIDYFTYIDFCNLYSRCFLIFTYNFFFITQLKQ